MEYIGELLVSLLTALIMGLSSLWGQPQMSPPDTHFLIGTTTGYVVQVIDGDTIVVTIGTSSHRVTVRYIGIDTPEPFATKIPECGSTEASARNRELVQSKTVALVPGLDPYDDYNRLLAYVYVDDIFVNETLVREGFATVMMFSPNTQYKTTFSNLYTEARTQQLGIWAMCE